MATYVIPAGDKVNLALVPGYVIPDGDKVALRFGAGAGEVFGVGIAPGLFGTASLSSSNKTLLPSGFTSGVVSGNLVVTKSLMAQGFNGSLVSPNATIYNNTPQIFPGGLDQSSFGAATIDLRLKPVTPAGMAPPGAGWASSITHDLQYVIGAGNILQEAYGTANVTYSNRTVFPIPVNPPAITGPRVAPQAPVGPLVGIFADGYGSPTIAAYGHVVNVAGLDSARYGQPTVRNQFAIVSVAPIQPDAFFGASTIYNLVQYLGVQPFANQVDPAGYGTFLIEDRNKTVGATGNVMSKYGIPDMYNLAVPAAPNGWESLVFGKTLVAYRNRSIAPEPINSSYITNSHQIYTNGQVLQVHGWDSSLIGSPKPFNRNLFLKQYLGYAGESFGTAFIAPAIRSLGPYSIAQPPQSLPEIRFNPFPIAPLGIDSYRTSATYVVSIQKIILPKSILTNPDTQVPGVESVLLRNRTVSPYGPITDFYGRPTVRNYIQSLAPLGYTTESWTAQNNIAYRTKQVTAAATAPLSISVIHRIYNVLPDPPGRQLILTGGFSSAGVSDTVSMSYQTVFPAGMNSSAYGLLKIYSTTLQPRGIYDDSLVGIPLVSAAQYLTIGQYNGNAEPAGYGRPRVDPLSVFAPGPNSPVSNPNNEGWYGEGSFPWFGWHDVALKNRTVPVTTGGDQSGYGVPFLSFGTQYVYPAGKNLLRMGAITFYGVAQNITMDDGTYAGPAGDYGLAAIGPPPVAPFINGQGFDDTLFGANTIELKNRPVYVAPGTDQSTFGQQMIGTRRYFDYTGAGFDSSSFGTGTFIAYRIRTVYPTGNDMLLMEPDIYNYAQRMRVVTRHFVSPAGLVPSGMGATQISDKNLGVGQGGHSVVGGSLGDARVGSVLRPAGVAPGSFGVIQYAPPGTVAMQGDDLARYGQAIIARAIGPAGVAPGGVGSPRRATPIRTTGLPPVGFDGPTVTDEYGCSQRWFPAQSIISAETFGSATVHV